MKILSLCGALLLVPLTAAGQTLPGSTDVDGSRLRAGAWDVSLVVHREGQTIPLGTQHYQLLEIGGAEPKWMLITTTSSEIGEATDTVIAHRSSLVPVRHRSHTVKRNMFLEFDGTSVTGTFEPAEGPVRTIDRTTDTPTFDSGMLEMIISALPLRTGYATRIPTYIEEHDGLTWFDVKVTGERTVDGVAGWVVHATGPTQPVEFVIAKEERRMIAGSTVYPNGVRMEMKRM